MSAASKGDVEGMQAYIDKYGTDKTDAVRGEPAAYTALMWASKAGNVAGINFLLDHGADIDRPDFAGERPVVIAGWMGRTDAVMTLIRRGANLGLRNDAGQDVIAKALSHGHAETAAAVRDYLAAETARKKKEFNDALRVINEGLKEELPVTRAKFPKPRDRQQRRL
jgi:ankyrin repeat protein